VRPRRRPGEQPIQLYIKMFFTHSPSRVVALLMASSVITTKMRASAVYGGDISRAPAARRAFFGIDNAAASEEGVCSLL